MSPISSTLPPSLLPTWSKLSDEIDQLRTQAAAAPVNNMAGDPKNSQAQTPTHHVLAATVPLTSSAQFASLYEQSNLADGGNSGHGQEKYKALKESPQPKTDNVATEPEEKILPHHDLVNLVV